MANSDYRVSLKFSEKDSDQTEVVRLLKQMGRRKSAFITKAIKYYLNENPDADIPGVTSTTISKSSVRAILKELLEEMDIQKSQIKTESAKPQKKEEEKNISEANGETNNDISDAELDNFLEGLEDWDIGE